MKIDTVTGLLNDAQFIASPNHDERSGEQATDLVVVHNISLPPGQFGGNGVIELFTNSLDPKEHPYYAEIAELRVSSHLFIRRDGSVIQFVPFHQRAWHAGVSSYQGKSACNDFSIGIELEGTDDLAYEDQQYIVLSEVIEALLLAYPELSRERITGHCDIAPERKTDPGSEFSWSRLAQLLHVKTFEKA